MKYLWALGLVLSTCVTTFAADSSWTDRWSLKGDFRFRNEQIKDGANTAGTVITETERNRHRIRARLTAQGKVNDAVDTAFRLATGNATPDGTTTTNQDATGYGAKKNFNLDLAYANWHPTEDVAVWVGKTPIPFYQPGTSDLMLDTDFTPEGVSYKDQLKGENLGLFWNVGYSVLSEQHNSTAPASQTDVMIQGADLGMTGSFGDTKMVFGMGAVNFANIKDTPVTVSGSTISKGNTVVAGTYANRYEIIRGYFDMNLPIAGIPMGFFVDYLKNSATTDDNYAQLVGFKIGQLKNKGDILFVIDTRELKKDATLGAITESDGAGGGTDVKSTRAILSYQLDQGINLAAAYYEGKRNVSTLDIGYKRAMIDANFNF